MGNQQSYACNSEDNVEVWEQTLVNLTQSTFSDESLQRLAQHLSTNKHSRALVLDRCTISDEASIPLMKSLRRNNSLLYLSLSSNQIGKEGADELLDALEQNSQLLWVDISNNSTFPEELSSKIRLLLTDRRAKSQLAVSQPSLLAPLSLNALRNNSPKSGRPIRVLSLDGGGVRLLAQLAILQQIEAQTGKQIDSIFDLIVTTGFGSLLAVALMRKLSLSQTREAMHQIVQKVLLQQNITAEWSESFWNSGWYDVANLEALLATLFTADAKLLSPAATPKVCLVCSPQGAAFSAMKPTLLRSYSVALPDLAKTYSHKKTVDCSLVEAIRASSATRGFFSSKQVGTHTLSDGSDIAPNPSEIAFHEAAMTFPDSAVSLLLSLGAGYRPSEETSSYPSGAYALTARHQLVAEGTQKRVGEWLAAIEPQAHYVRVNFAAKDIPIDAKSNEMLSYLEAAGTVSEAIAATGNDWQKMIESLKTN